MSSPVGRTREPVIMSWSGGKDSSLALSALQADPDVEVVGLLTSVTRGFERISIHGVRRTLLEKQATRIGLPLHVVELQPQSSNAAYEAAFNGAAMSLRERHPDLGRIAFGDLFLEDVRAYREALLAPLELSGLYPLWQRNTTKLAREFINAGFRARIVCVDTTQLDPAFCGREFDTSFLADLPPTADPCGERGEFHTFVHDGPIFHRPVRYSVGESVLRDERFMYTDLIDA